MQATKTRYLTLVGLAALTALAWGVLTGCSESERHKILTTFFDGVPPMEGPWDGGVALQKITAEDGAESGSTWTLHEPIQDCTQCHGQKQKRGFSRQVQLVAQPPALCDQCHTRPTAEQGWVHGPVVQGECMFCHEPHKTQTPHLLRETTPALCYQCHDATSVQQIKLHHLPSYEDCLRCHVGHASPERYLLRPSGDGPGSLGAAMQNAIAEYGQTIQERAQNDWAAGKSLREMWNMVLAALQQEDLFQARAYLEVMKTSGALPADATMWVDQITAEWVTMPPTDTPAMQALNQCLARQEREVANLYYRSMNLMNQGHWQEAHDSLSLVLKSGVLPQGMRSYALSCLDSLAKHLQPQGETSPGF